MRIIPTCFACAILLVLNQAVSRAVEADASPEPAPAVATLKVTTDRPDGLYRQGDPIVFSILMSENGQPVAGRQLSYTLKGDGLLEQKGQLTSAREPLCVTGRLDRPGWININVTGSDAAGNPIPWWKLTGIAGAAVDPFQVKAGQAMPEDFDAFWTAQKEKLAKVPQNLIEVADTKKSGTNMFQVLCVKVDIGEDLRPLMALVAIPQDAAPKSLPAKVSFPGAGVRSLRFGLMPGTLTLQMNVHGLEDFQTADYYRKLSGEDLKDYMRMGADSRDTYYYRGVLLRILRALDYVKSRPEWDGKTLIVSGGSQGGGLALAAAGLDPQVTQCLAFMPALCDHLGYTRDQFSGWPQLVPLDPKTRQPRAPDVARTSGYYDGVNFAARIKAATEVRIGLKDTTCPPTSVFAAFNNLATTNKRLWIYPEAGHMLVGSSFEIKQP